MFTLFDSNLYCGCKLHVIEEFRHFFFAISLGLEQLTPISGTLPRARSAVPGLG
jgi:hypothetical protein